MKLSGGNYLGSSGFKTTHPVCAAVIKIFISALERELVIHIQVGLGTMHPTSNHV